ncbi:MAG: ATPase, T2SS/T4P/T4SS family [Acidimicrobiales bacterium]
MSTIPTVATRRRLGEILVDLELVTEEELSRALATQRVQGKRLGEVLLEEGLIPPTGLLRALAEQFGLDYLELDGAPVDLELVQRIPASIAERHRAVPVAADGDVIVVAMANPVDVVAKDDIRNILSAPVRTVLADPEQISRVIARGASADSKVREVLLAAADDVDDVPMVTSSAGDPGADAPIVRFVDLLLAKAIQERASDIHVEPSGSGLRIRFRIDGVLHDALDPPPSLQAGLLARIKVMTGLDIAERRLPQDGRASVQAGDERVDIRVATAPTVHGESAVLRILRTDAALASIDRVGLLPPQLAPLQSALDHSWGIVLVTGPTGSGKTTTLYAALQQLNDPARSIVTVEDPVEYRLDGLKQVQVNTKADLTFARVLRSFLRLDPDIMLVGEIRDAETAQIAVESSLTGHLVLSSVHTNGAASAPVRLVEMGVEPYLVAASIRAVTAQRLVRRVCTACAVPERLDPALVAAIGFPLDLVEEDGSVTIRRGQGCERCARTGFRGRLAIHEVMPWCDELSDLVVRRAPVFEVHNAAVAAGLMPIREAGLRQVIAGLTTPEEVLAAAG